MPKTLDDDEPALRRISGERRGAVPADATVAAESRSAAATIRLRRTGDGVRARGNLPKFTSSREAEAVARPVVLAAREERACDSGTVAGQSGKIMGYGEERAGSEGGKLYASQSKRILMNTLASVYINYWCVCVCVDIMYALVRECVRVRMYASSVERRFN